MPTFGARRAGEEPFITVTSWGAKQPAAVVNIVLYSHETLVEDGDASSEADYEIISINARTTLEEEPLTPVAMMRNFLELTGGTKAEYSAEDFAKSIHYWSARCQVSHD